MGFKIFDSLNELFLIVFVYPQTRFKSLLLPHSISITQIHAGKSISYAWDELRCIVEIYFDGLITKQNWQATMGIIRKFMDQGVYIQILASV